MNRVALSKNVFGRRLTGALYTMLVLAQVGASSDYQQQQIPQKTQYYEQQQQQQEYSQRNENMPSPSTTATVPEQASPNPERFVPHMTPEHVALSLRLTCERNRRLVRGSTFGVRQKPEIVVNQPQQHHITVPPSLPSTTKAPAEEETTTKTVFHATSRCTPAEAAAGDKKKILSGVEQWGPNLQSFITELTSNILQLTDDESSIVLSLSMIYLDRASSVETLRSSGAPPCPFATFRTVHRLLLSSILTAAQVARSKSIVDDYQEQIEDLIGVSAKDLHTMMTWMKYALGDSGHFVGLGEMQKFKRMWERVFFSTGSHNPSNDGNGNPNSDRKRQTDSEQVISSVSTKDDGLDATERAPTGFFSSPDTSSTDETLTSPSKTGTSSPAAAAVSTSSGGVGAGPAKTQQFSKPPAFVHSKHSAAFAT